MMKLEADMTGRFSLFEEIKPGHCHVCHAVFSPSYMAYLCRLFDPEGPKLIKILV